MPHSKTVDVGHVRHESATTPLTAALAPKAPGERWTQALRWGLPGGRERQRQCEGGGAAPSPPLLPTVSLRLFDSPHCEHLRRHPREYLELMESFSRAIEEEEDKEEDAILQV